MIPHDTTPDAQAVQDRIWREMLVARRLDLVGRMAEETRDIVRAGIRRDDPHLGDAAVNRRLWIELHGMDVGCRRPDNGEGQPRVRDSQRCGGV